jgi:hypothetical protein
MTIFRFRGMAGAPLLMLIGCGAASEATAEACSPQPLSTGLQVLTTDRKQADEIARCLTESAVKLSSAGDPGDQVAQAVVTACQRLLNRLELEADIRRFERGDPIASAGTAEVRREAHSYALSRVVQVRAGQCARKS